LGVGIVVAYSSERVRLDRKAMVFVRATTATSRADLVQSCLQELRIWPGCESVGTIGVLAGEGRLTAAITAYNLKRQPKYSADNTESEGQTESEI
jgi:hypothetical protein